MTQSKFWLSLTIFLSTSLAFVCTACVESDSQPNGNQDSLTIVRFGMLPYADHTYAIIGIEKGWFREVGIELDYKTIQIEQAVPILQNGGMDIVSVPPGVLMSAYENAPNLRSFVFGDLFQGYAVMAQPDNGYRTYREFLADGLSHNDALRATVQQMKGSVFAFPTEAAIKPFIDKVLQVGGLKDNDVKAAVLDDPLTINAMRNNSADFQVGGVPSRIILQREGFIPILSSVDLAIGAIPSESSEELASILQNGWATSTEYFTKNFSTILRLSSVNYRIMRYINQNQDSALSIHMPFLSQVTGESFSNNEGTIIYNDLNPFVTFEGQDPWFSDTTNPLYYRYVNGSILNSFKIQGAFKEKAPDLEAIIYADDVYHAMVELKSMADSLFDIIEQLRLDIPDHQAKKLSDAKSMYDIYNYYDAVRIALELIDGLSTTQQN